MSDRLALSNAIEDAGIERAKAERIASTIVDLIHDNVATKADVSAVGADLRRTEIALKADIAAVDAKLTLVGHRLMTRLGGLMVVVAGAVVAALHLLAATHRELTASGRWWGSRRCLPSLSQECRNQAGRVVSRLLGRNRGSGTGSGLVLAQARA